MNVQRTLRRSVSCAGIGLHSGKRVSLSIRPAPAGAGIRFRRADLGGLEVPATVQHVGGINYATGLTRDAVHIDTVEHLLSALISLGIDNVLVDPVGTLSRQLNAFAYPTTLFFDSRGMLFMRQVGGITKASLEERLTMLREASHDALPERTQAISGTSPARDH